MDSPVKQVLIVISADPRVSARAAEAVRIAAGAGAWEKVEVKVCLCGEASRLVTEQPEDLVNGDVVEAYLPLLLEGTSRVCAVVPHGGPAGVQSVTVAELAALSRSAHSTLRF